MARTKRVLTEDDKATRAFDVTQTAEYLNLDRKTVLRMLGQGTIKGVKIGRDWRISKAELDRLLTGGVSA
jgi:excisionase family DNA binding protein